MESEREAQWFLYFSTLFSAQPHFMHTRHTQYAEHGTSVENFNERCMAKLISSPTLCKNAAFSQTLPIVENHVAMRNYHYACMFRETKYSNATSRRQD